VNIVRKNISEISSNIKFFGILRRYHGFFSVGRGTVTGTFLAAIICVVDVKLIWDILREEEKQNA
jgi:hypothetical protein